MEPDVGTGPEERKRRFSALGELFFFALFFFVPTLNMLPFVWLTGTVATPVAWLLATRGIYEGGRLLRNSLLLAALLSLFAGRLSIFLFLLSIVPMGYAFWQGIIRHESAAKSGLRGLLAFCLAGLLFWLGYAAATGVNPYSQLREAVDRDIRQNMDLLVQQEQVPSAELEEFQLRMETFRKQMPELLPAILGLIAISTIWLNMVLISALLSRFGRQAYPWGRYEVWKLPDQFIWVPLGATALLLFVGEGLLWQAACVAMLLSILLYFFQGLAVLLALLNRWQTPLPMRLLLYGAILIFPPVALLLPVLGVIEIWAPVRRNHAEQT